MADKGEYGEPRFIGKPRHGLWQHRAADGRFTLGVWAFDVEHEDGDREAARVRGAANSMRGISDPERFMADVRELIRLDKDHDIDGGGCYGCRTTIARLRAQLKGGE